MVAKLNCPITYWRGGQAVEPNSVSLLAGQLRGVEGAIGLCEESSQVCRGDVFVACADDPVKRAKHIGQALENGAIALALDSFQPRETSETGSPLPIFSDDVARVALSRPTIH